MTLIACLQSGIQGFYDPAPKAPKSLRVRYMFRDQMHYAEIPDLVSIVLPLRGRIRPFSGLIILTPFFIRPFGRVRRCDLVPKIVHGLSSPIHSIQPYDRLVPAGSFTRLTSTRDRTGCITFILYIYPPSLHYDWITVHRHRDSLRRLLSVTSKRLTFKVRAVVYEEHVEGVLCRMSLHTPSHSMSDINDARTRSSSGIGWWRNRPRSAVMYGSARHAWERQEEAWCSLSLRQKRSPSPKDAVTGCTIDSGLASRS